MNLFFIIFQWFFFQGGIFEIFIGLLTVEVIFEILKNKGIIRIRKKRRHKRRKKHRNMYIKRR